MVSYSLAESGRILTLSYGGHVTPREIEAYAAAIRRDRDRLRPGAVLLSDMTLLESMDPDCAEPLGAAMELISEFDISLVIRVIPDPAKDIGFNLISRFHYRKSVRAVTVPTLAEALVVLLSEAASLQPVEG